MTANPSTITSRKIDDDAVMGIMNGKHFASGVGRHFYFYLERVTD
jgi:hypothetical protein